MDSIISFIVGDNKDKKFDACEEVIVDYAGDEGIVREAKADEDEIPVIDFGDQTLQQMFDTENEANFLQQLKNMIHDIHCEWPFPDNFTRFEDLQREVRLLKEENTALHKRIAELESRKRVAFNPNRGDKI